MPDIKSILNDEIRRLAKKEIKLAVLPLVKTISEQRKMISELKKRISILEKIKVAAADKSADTDVKNDGNEVKLRLNAAGIARVRNKLKLTQSEFAKILGVSTHTVSIWELGKTAPRQGARTAICALRTVGKREIKRMLEAANAK